MLPLNPEVFSVYFNPFPIIFTSCPTLYCIAANFWQGKNGIDEWGAQPSKVEVRVYPILALPVQTVNVPSADFTEHVTVSMPGLVNE